MAIFCASGGRVTGRAGGLEGVKGCRVGWVLGAWVVVPAQGGGLLQAFMGGGPATRAPWPGLAKVGGWLGGLVVLGGLVMTRNLSLPSPWLSWATPASSATSCTRCLS